MPFLKTTPKPTNLNDDVKAVADPIADKAQSALMSLFAPKATPTPPVFKYDPKYGAPTRKIKSED